VKASDRDQAVLGDLVDLVKAGMPGVERPVEVTDPPTDASVTPQRASGDARDDLDVGVELTGARLVVAAAPAFERRTEQPGGSPLAGRSASVPH
jgi:hypothetical protein